MGEDIEIIGDLWYVEWKLLVEYEGGQLLFHSVATAVGPRRNRDRRRAVG